MNEKPQINISHSVIIYSMLDMLELRDGYTGAHVQHVEDFMSFMIDEMLINNKWELSRKDAYIYSQSALLHDIGKIAIPDSILLKPGKLTEDEFEIVKTHTVLGAESLKRTMVLSGESDFMSAVYDITRHHHERWDGCGYPDGLKGDEIPLVARIAAIADVYDALRSKRPYKNPMDRQTAFDIILEGKGTSFDPALVDVFLLAEDKFDNYTKL